MLNKQFSILCDVLLCLLVAVGDAEELDVEDERGAAGDQAAAGARVAIPIDDKRSFYK